MNVSISKSEIAGTITAPASKSVMQRACAAALIRGGAVTIHHYGRSNDDKAALNIIKQLGAVVTTISDDLLEIVTEQFPENIVSQVINCGESGLSARMFTSIAALCNQEMSITGEGSLLRRPFHFFEEILPQLGVSVLSANGKLPISLQGTMQARDITIDGSLSSQYLTGLLFAFSSVLNQNANIYVDSLNSKPYIDLTLEVMSDFGLNVPENNNYKEFIFHKSQISNLKSQIHYTIEGDWSGAAFLLVAGAINGAVTVTGLKLGSLQADRKVLDVLRQCGCDISVEDTAITVAKDRLQAFQFDATDCPDLFPPLAALAMFCNGTSYVKGVHRLTHKESNRAESIMDMCRRFGSNIAIQHDDMIITGGSALQATTVNPFNDHRIAMAAAIIAINIDGETIISDAECVNKSYPAFWMDMENVGINMTTHLAPHK